MEFQGALAGGVVAGIIACPDSAGRQK